MPHAIDAATLLVWVPRLRRYARALAGNRDDADDLVQATLEKAWSRAASWQGVADMRAWLFTILHHVHVDGVRGARVHTVPLDDATPEVPVPPAHDGRLAVLDCEAALARLSAEQREVLLLVALEDLPYADAARVLGIPVGTVMSRLSRARERLRGLMDGGGAASAAAPVSAADGTREATRLHVVGRSADRLDRP